jgi:hypothetical protein
VYLDEVYLSTRLPRQVDGRLGGRVGQFARRPMRLSIVRSLAVVLTAAVVVSCGSSEPAAPPAPDQPVSPNPTAPAPNPPATLGIYDRLTPSVFVGTSRYVLYQDSSFALEYVAGATYRYPGRFTRSDSLVRFNFTVPAASEPWIANAVLRGTVLAIQYNTLMLLSDFENGEYLREP